MEKIILAAYHYVPSTGRNGVCGRTSVRCSCVIGDSLIYSICTLDCTKQATIMINLIYLDSTNVSNFIFISAQWSNLTAFNMF